MDVELMFAVLDVAEVFFPRPHIVLPKDHSLDAVFSSPLSPLFATLQSWRMHLKAVRLISLYSFIMTINKILID